MDGASFERVYDNFQDFHAFFAASFGRKQWREHSRNYLQGLLVQAGERRNAENPESVGISARAMQRFLTRPGGTMPRSSRLQEYLAPRLVTPRRCGCWTAHFPKQGRKSVGVARQYCGLGKVANCQAGMFLAYVSPWDRHWWTRGCICPISDQDRCAAAGVPEERLSYRSKTELALELLERALGLGHLKAGWVARRLRDVAVLSGVPGGPGDALRAGRSGQHSGLAPGVGLAVWGLRGPGAPASPGSGTGSVVPWSSAVASCRIRLGGR